MTPTTEISMPHPSFLRRCVRWLFSIRGLGFMVFLACLAATLVGLLYAVENWRGRRAWQAYRTDAAARGVVLDYSELIPPPIPDEQNFAVTPFLKPLFDFRPGTQQWRDMDEMRAVVGFAGKFLDEISAEEQKKLRSVISKDRKKLMKGDWRQAQHRDSVAIYLMHILDGTNATISDSSIDPSKLDEKQAAEAFLKKSGQFDPILAELRDAGKRPGSRFPIHYQEENAAGILLPHLAVLKKLSQILSHRASAALTLGRTDEALADVRLGLRLAESLSFERTLISYLVRVAIMNLMVQPVWEGVADRRWNDSQLVELMDTFGREQPMAAMKYALDGERGFGNSLIELMRRRPDLYASFASPPPNGGEAEAGFSAIKWMPSGWLLLEQLEYNKMMDALLKLEAGLSTQASNPAAYSKQSAEWHASLQPSPGLLFQHRIFAQMLLPALANVRVKTAQLASTLAMLRSSCALERYYLSKQSYPESLSGLAPTYISEVPKDAIKGGELNYQRVPKERYRLSTLRLKGIEEGHGKPIGRGEEDSDDSWVWAYGTEQ